MEHIIFVIIVTLFGSWAYTPKRNYRSVESTDVKETIKGLNEHEILSFKSDDIEVSVKRKNNRILIEPYLPRLKEALVRAVAFGVSICLISILLGVIAIILDIFHVGDIEYDDFKAKDVNWKSGVLPYYAGKFWYVNMIIAIVIGKQIRLKLINKFLQRKNQKQWDVFNQTYSEYEYKTKND